MSGPLPDQEAHEPPAPLDRSAVLQMAAEITISSPGGYASARVRAASWCEEGNWEQGVLEFLVILDSALKALQDPWGQDEIANAIQTSSQALMDCLDLQSRLQEGERLEPDLQRQMRRALYDLWWYDITQGGLALAGDALEALCRTAGTTDREMVRSWIDAEHRRVAGLAPRWTESALAYFRARLDDGGGEGNHWKEELANRHLWSELALVLLDEGSVQEALALADKHLRRASPVVSFADALLGTGEEWVQKAFDFVETRLDNTPAENNAEVDTYLGWLGKRYLQHGRANQALKIERRRFTRDPGYEAYLRVCAAAGPSVERWAEIREPLTRVLERRGDWDTLVRIYLAENNSRDARVCRASALERDEPDRAASIYTQLAEELIAAGGDRQYREAGGYLTHAQALFVTQGREEEWNRYFHALASEHRSHRSLQRALLNAGLLQRRD